ncbi:hypothetical protein VTJ49DRAFT_486 [Mycothermus thermophilus]|uniref:C2H2-type domain-containing protein n=1 Tax=Humicola insolens TaxID=85995 RepID=A0ABR3VFD5_HUMIN
MWRRATRRTVADHFVKSTGTESVPSTSDQVNSFSSPVFQSPQPQFFSPPELFLPPEFFLPPVFYLPEAFSPPGPNQYATLTIHTCQWCGIRFASTQSLVEHFILYPAHQSPPSMRPSKRSAPPPQHCTPSRGRPSPGETVRCAKCNLHFPDTQSLAEHFEKSPAHPYTVSAPPNSWTTPRFQDYPEAESPDVKPHCTLCGITFADAQGLATHFANSPVHPYTVSAPENSWTGPQFKEYPVQEESLHLCVPTGFKSKARAEKNQGSAPAVGPVVCKCGKTLKTEDARKQHVKDSKKHRGVRDQGEEQCVKAAKKQTGTEGEGARPLEDRDKRDVKLGRKKVDRVPRVNVSKKQMGSGGEEQWPVYKKEEMEPPTDPKVFAGVGDIPVSAEEVEEITRMLGHLFE